ncbi:MAG: hypothetical protein UX89_C0009G0018 [Parcubacteria group bacterium GW2011_GWA2_47_16]|nr:MAG: hypothetical protein UX89_C0009G0018 [Parcubacteria group bacterium GW2011_GWA2_47_16]
MKNNLQKVFLVAIIGILIFPQVSFAAWWNPLTWFQKPPADTPVSEVAATGTPIAENSQADETPEIKAENVAVAESEEGAVATKWWNPSTWKVFDRTPTVKVQEVKQPTEIEKLRSEVEELKKKVASPVTPPVKPPAVVADKSKVELTAPTTGQPKITITPPVAKESDKIPELAQVPTPNHRLSDLDMVINALITNAEANITYAKEMITSIEFYGNNFTNAKTLIISLSNSETDPVVRNAYDFLTSQTNLKLNYYEALKKFCLSVIQEMEDEIGYLKKEKEKNFISNPVSTENYLVYYKELNTNSIEKYRALLIKDYDEFISITNKFQSDMRLIMGAIDTRTSANHRAQIDALNTERESFRASSVTRPIYDNYQPNLYPTIQMPQITRCTVSGDGGVGLQAYINCSTSNF